MGTKTQGKGWHKDHSGHVGAGKRGVATKQKNQCIEELKKMDSTPTPTSLNIKAICKTCKTLTPHKICYDYTHLALQCKKCNRTKHEDDIHWKLKDSILKSNKKPENTLGDSNVLHNRTPTNRP